jgi:hypothetical protein
MDIAGTLAQGKSRKKINRANGSCSDGCSWLMNTVI